MNSRTTVLIAVIVSVAATAGIMSLIGFNPQVITDDAPETGPVESEATEEDTVENDTPEQAGVTNDIRKISSQKELEDILYASQSFAVPRNFNMQFAGRDIVMTESFAMPADAGFQSIREGGQSAFSKTANTEYSTTNVQVAGIDEPDYIKNDSKYVYIVSENILTVIDAYPAETASVVLRTALDVESQYIQNMFLNGDRLVIFYDEYGVKEAISQYGFIPYDYSYPVTHALIVDVTDKGKPNILKDYSIEGYFQDARMIGDYAYFVTNSHVDYQHPRFPVIWERNEPIMTSETFYFENAGHISNFNTLTAIDIFGGAINSESFLTGGSDTFYVSEDGFYLTYQQYPESGFSKEVLHKRFFDAIVPLLPDGLQDGIRAIQGDSSSNAYEQWMEISEIMQETYGEMTADEREELFKKIDESTIEYDIRSENVRVETVIHKISIDEDRIEYVARGTVPGRLLNQFSMDQSGERFRIATTTEQYTEYHGLIRANAVYVLDEQLDVVGGLDQIARGESIFASRFIGDRLYLVTFQQIDPFFVIDLSADTPEILGELKIPGFSNYLHPYDEDHIIGIGMDTDEVGNGRVQTRGVKLALFNVADVGNPKVLDETVIGSWYASSAANADHRAFFFEKATNILSIPVMGRSDAVGDSECRDPRCDFWSGFYVFDLDEKDGFELRGTIEHMVKPERHWVDRARTFYIGDVLYTEYGLRLKMSSIDSLEEINSVDLGRTGKFIDYIE